MPAARTSAAVFRSRSGILPLVALAVGVLASCTLLLRQPSSGAEAFVGGAAPRAFRGHVAVQAEADAPSPSPSVALVKVTEENKVTTASVLGGLAGLLVGGVWVGGALFAATAYLSRKEDSDVSKALKGVASGGLEVLNFGAYLNDKYTVTDKIGSALTNAVDSAKSDSKNKDSIESVTGFFDSAKDALAAADKDIGFKDTLGTLATSASELAAQAVDKAVEVNEQYKLTDKLKEKIDEAVASSKTSSGKTP